MPLNNIERPFTFAIEAEGDDFYKYLRNVLILVKHALIILRMKRNKNVKLALKDII